MTAILGADGRPIVSRPAKPHRNRLRASYDAASTNTRNERHWANADGKSASAATSYEVRQKLRQRARYECHESNSYAAGIVRTLANDAIGTGPRLQLMIPGRPDVGRRLEREFRLWAYEARLAEKLRTMRVSKAVDGEAFAAFVTNDALPTRVRLDLALIECDRVKSPWWQLDPEAEDADGITFDAAGNPRTYYVLKEHPGSDFITEFGKFDEVAARDMVHLFRCDRPGQRRGVPEIAPALELFALLRRFTKATLHAAETAASYAGVLQTADYEPGDEDATPGETIEVEHNSLLVLPNGRTLSQLKPEHPATTFEMFKREVIREMARCLNVPYNVAAGDSSNYNYASGRLDHQTYDRSIRIEQDYVGLECLDRVFERFVAELRLDDLTDGRQRNRGRRLPPDERVVKDWDNLPPVADWEWLWFYDARPHVDPLKEATATSVALESGQTTEAEIGAKDGVDWEDRQRQRAKELGLSLADFRKLKAIKQFAGSQAATEAALRILGEEAAADEAAADREAADAA